MKTSKTILIAILCLSFFSCTKQELNFALQHTPPENHVLITMFVQRSDFWYNVKSIPLTDTGYYWTAEGSIYAPTAGSDTQVFTLINASPEFDTEYGRIELRIGRNQATKTGTTFTGDGKWWLKSATGKYAGFHQGGGYMTYTEKHPSKDPDYVEIQFDLDGLAL